MNEKQISNYARSIVVGDALFLEEVNKAFNGNQWVDKNGNPRYGRVASVSALGGATAATTGYILNNPGKVGRGFKRATKGAAKAPKLSSQAIRSALKLLRRGR